MRRGETVEVSSPSAGFDAGPRLREQRPLGRCHTLDSGEQTLELPVPTHTPNMTEYTPQEGNQTDDAHAENTAGVQMSRDDTKSETNETQSADDCSTGSEISPSSTSNAPTQADDPSEPSPTHTSTASSASHDGTEPHDTNDPRPLNGELESPDDQTHTDNEVLQSESKDADSSPTCPADLHPTVPTDGGDQRDDNAAPEGSAESDH